MDASTARGSGPGEPGSNLPGGGSRDIQGATRMTGGTAGNRTGAVTLFLCSDVMTGRGIDQVLPDSLDPRLHEPHVRSARRYLELARRAGAEIPDHVPPEWVWGEALEELRRAAPDLRIANLETAVTDAGIPWRGRGSTTGCTPGTWRSSPPPAWTRASWPTITSWTGAGGGCPTRSRPSTGPGSGRRSLARGATGPGEPWRRDPDPAPGRRAAGGGVAAGRLIHPPPVVPGLRPGPAPRLSSPGHRSRRPSSGRTASWRGR